jgi:outer membrane protein OmpA-like peptidoglycan-associated protein
MLKRILSLAFAWGLASCALPPNVVVLIPDEGGTVGKVVVATDGTEAPLSNAYAALGTGDGPRDRKVFTTDRPTVESEFAGALASTPRPLDVFTVYFVIGQAEIDPASAGTVASAVQAALTTPYADISVVGHSDATGGDAENLALSLRRATAIRDTLVKGGVRASTIDIAYHGSNNPAIPTPRGVSQPRNRRVEVTIR